MAESSQGPEASLTHVRYDPESVANVGVFKNRFVLPIRAYEEEGEEFIVVRLTARGNEALREVCHTADQKEVWRFPSYEFVVHKDSLSVAQVGGSFYRTKIGLIELVDLNCTVFVEDVQLPGYWGGSWHCSLVGSLRRWRTDDGTFWCCFCLCLSVRHVVLPFLLV